MGEVMSAPCRPRPGVRERAAKDAVLWWSDAEAFLREQRTHPRPEATRNDRCSNSGRIVCAKAAAIMPWWSASMQSLTRPVPTLTESRKPKPSWYAPRAGSRVRGPAAEARAHRDSPGTTSRGPGGTGTTAAPVEPLGSSSGPCRAPPGAQGQGPHG